MTLISHTKDCSVQSRRINLKVTTRGLQCGDLPSRMLSSEIRGPSRLIRPRDFDSTLHGKIICMIRCAGNGCSVLEYRHEKIRVACLSSFSPSGFPCFSSTARVSLANCAKWCINISTIEPAALGHTHGSRINNEEGHEDVDICLSPPS